MVCMTKRVSGVRDTMLHRRLPKDIDLLKKNESSLKQKGIYFAVQDEDLTKLSVLITPRHKYEQGTFPLLESPYTGGFFVFELSFPQDYPLSPPQVSFNPKQTQYRLHPNYYTTGKVCLSIINTWGQPDWSPSMSLMSLLITLEERFFERALGCEPGCENSDITKHHHYNNYIEYVKYKVAMIDVVENKYGTVYTPFTSIIQDEIQANLVWHTERVNTMMTRNQGKHLACPHYNSVGVTCDTVPIKRFLMAQRPQS